MMVLLSIKVLKASGIRGLTQGNRLSTWAIVATDSAYSALAVNIEIFSSKFLVFSIKYLTLG